MSILTLVAAETVLRYFLLQIAAAMAVLTINPRVHAEQREPGLLRVIELCRLPTSGCMAVITFGPAPIAMNVIGRMTRYAPGGSVLVMLREMTTGAGYVDVTVAQRKRRSVVVEMNVAPQGSVMAGLAVASQSAGVRFFLVMAVDTVGRCLTERFAGGMTTGT